MDKMTEKLLNLQYNQKIIIENNVYYITAMLKFIEGSSYWLEYILRQESTGKQYFLDVEPIGKYALHELLNININIDFCINYENNIYELYQKGNAKIQTYYGYTDVGLKEDVEYYEYIYNNNLLTIEKWKNNLEISKGMYISKTKIKIPKIEDDNFRL